MPIRSQLAEKTVQPFDRLAVPLLRIVQGACLLLADRLGQPTGGCLKGAHDGG
jgi:hypothetical protein